MPSSSSGAGSGRPRAIPAIEGMSAYTGERPVRPVDLFLDGNEGIVPDAAIVESLGADPTVVVRNYPRSADLRAAIAGRWGVEPGRVAVTAGVDDALDRLCRSMLGPARSAVVPLPTFEMIERYVTLTGAERIAVPWPEGDYPAADVLDAVRSDTAVVFVVTPNNPTGATASAAQVREMAAARPGVLFIVDLAYVDFATVDPTADLLDLDNVVVLRTLSKAWGLAGLRVGYAIGSPGVIEWMARVGQPYAVSGPSLACAAWWLERGQEKVRAWVSGLREERSRLSAQLAALGGRPVASEANFVLSRFDRPGWVHAALESLGIVVRRWPDRPGLEDALRITLPGDAERFERLLAALEAVLAPEALLLDMDGVLADVSRSHRETVRETARRFGVEIEPAEIAEAKRRGGANNDWDLTWRLLERHGVRAGLDEVTDVFERIYHGEDGRPGLREQERQLIDAGALGRLAGGMPLGIVTGRPLADAERTLEAFGLAEMVTALVGHEDGPGKPDPAPVRLALERLGVRRAVMVGDTVDDVRAARAAGVVPVGVIPPGDASKATRDALIAAGAACVVERLADLEPPWSREERRS